MDLLTHLRSSQPSFRSTYAPWDNFWFQKEPMRPNDVSAYAGSPDVVLKRLSMVWRCVRALSDDMASLSLILYRQLERGKERAKDHPLYTVLHQAPNGWQTPFLFEQLSQTHIELRGMFYARIIEDRFGRIQQLIPMNPDRITPELLPVGRLRFQHKKIDGTDEVLTQDEVHFRTGLTLDGVKGLSTIEAAAPTWARAMATERFSADFFTGGAIPPVALRHPLTLGPDGQKMLRDSLAAYRGGDKYLILEEAMEATVLGVNARDAQLLEVQQFNDEQIAGTFAVPAHRVGIMRPGSVSYASVENADLAYVKYRIGARAKANEESIARDLLSTVEQNNYVPEYLLESLLRGDTAARAAFYKALADVEAITPNEIRERENMNPLEGGDVVVKNVPKSQPPSNSPRDPMGRPTGRSDAEVRGRQITVEAAARVVQKEIAAAHKAAVRFASDPKGWQAWCSEFYRDHAGFISHVLKLPSHEANQYAESHRQALASTGLPAAADWETRAVPQLAALALGEDHGTYDSHV